MELDLSIVIVSWNTREDLRTCLAAVPDARGGLSTEVFVVDNASSDGSPQMVQDEFPKVILIESGANLGFAAGNNLALPSCQGRHILLLNPDTIPENNSLAKLSAFLDAHPGAGACGPLLTDTNGAPALSWGTGPKLRYHLLSLIDPTRSWLPGNLRTATAARLGPTEGRPFKVDYVVGACLMMTHKAYEQVGNLDERYFLYFEETDWCRRTQDLGMAIWCVPNSRVAHLEGRAAARVSRFSLAQFQASLRIFVGEHQGQARVPLYRTALFLEYSLKAMFRGLVSIFSQNEGRVRNAALASDHWFVALLQLQSRVDPRPPV